MTLSGFVGEVPLDADMTAVRGLLGGERELEGAKVSIG